MAEVRKKEKNVKYDIEEMKKDIKVKEVKKERKKYLKRRMILRNLIKKRRKVFG